MLDNSINIYVVPAFYIAGNNNIFFYNYLKWHNLNSLVILKMKIEPTFFDNININIYVVPFFL
jgi:hypothetical protein